MVRYEQNQQKENSVLKPKGTFQNRMDSDTIYNYTGKIASVKRRLERFEDSRIAIEFLDALKDHGLSKGRVSYYAARLD